METNASRVLIVDDMPVNRMILSSLLASRGVVADQAEGGYACLDMVRDHDYDLILLDHRMPDLDGVDTLTRLKDIFSQKGRIIPVICHTTEEARNNINLYKAAGFADVLIKPIDASQLSDVIMTYLPSDADQIHSSEPIPNLSFSFSDPETSFEMTEDDTRDELDKLPMWLKIVPHIDLNAGITNCGSAEDYVDALYVFRSSIDEKSSDLKAAVNDEEWTMYRLGVHSLKSMARLIGAKNLAEKATDLEAAADKDDHSKIRRDTDDLLAEYRRFNKLLDPLMEDKDIRQIMDEAADHAKEANSSQQVIDHSHTVLFVMTNQGIVTKGIEKNLTDNGFNVISVPDSPDAIINHRFEADIILYYPEICEDSHIGLTMNLLGEVCQDDSKLLCLTGDANDIEIAMDSKSSYRVSRCYPRPVKIEEFIDDMCYFSDLLSEYHRMKTIYVVDDDPDYRAIIDRWLTPHYNVSNFSGAGDMLSGLSTVTPDLILLDYEMPEMDGYELMKTLRSDPETANIPIIFLTGKNDRDHVFSILHYKPDGYMLKTSSKDALLDSIDRFFSETLFRMSLQPVPEPEEEE